MTITLGNFAKMIQIIFLNGDYRIKMYSNWNEKLMVELNSRFEMTEEFEENK